MPRSKGLNPHELAHKWMKGLGIRPNMSLKVGWQSHDMRIIGRIVGVQRTEQSVGIIVGAFAPNIIIYQTISDVRQLPPLIQFYFFQVCGDYIRNIFIFLLRFITALCYTTSTSNFGQDIFIMFQCPQKSLAKISFLNFICFFSKDYSDF